MIENSNAPLRFCLNYVTMKKPSQFKDTTEAFNLKTIIPFPTAPFQKATVCGIFHRHTSPVEEWTLLKSSQIPLRKSGLVLQGRLALCLFIYVKYLSWKARLRPICLFSGVVMVVKDRKLECLTKRQ